MGLVGEFVSELGEGETIVRWACAAPKSFIYEVAKVEDPSKVIRVERRFKGLSLAADQSESLTLPVLKGVLFEEQSYLDTFYARLEDLQGGPSEKLEAAQKQSQETGQLVIPQFRLRKSLRTLGICDESETATKKLGRHQDKRVFWTTGLGHAKPFTSYPYGFQDM